MSFLRTYGTTLGPVGIPMADDQAFALDAIFKQLPAEDQRLRKVAIPSALRYLASGLNDTHFLHNPLVTIHQLRQFSFDFPLSVCRV